MWNFAGWAGIPREDSLNHRLAAMPASSEREPFGWIPCFGMEQTAKEKTSCGNDQKASPPGELAPRLRGD